jgi:drug/metabolite transporter (DMT)-like permease
MILPLVWIYGLYRIQKLRKGLIVQIAMFVVYFGLITTFAIHGDDLMINSIDQGHVALVLSGLSFPIWWVINKRWVAEYNSKIAFK